MRLPLLCFLLAACTLDPTLDDETSAVLSAPIPKVQVFLQPFVTINSVSPDPVWTGQTVTVNAGMLNPSTSATSGWLSLRVDGAYKGEWPVSANPGGSDAKSFTVYSLSPGDHTLEVRYETPGQWIIVPVGPTGPLQWVQTRVLSASATQTVHARAWPRWNEVWSVATHNSYWFNNSHEICDQNLWATSDWHVTCGTKLSILDQLLYHGVRSIELDVHRDDGGEGYFDVNHSSVPTNSLCTDLEDCLDELRTFHFLNPQHEAVVVLLEMKGLSALDRVFDFRHTPDHLDALLADKLGPWLYKPADLKARCSYKPDLRSVTRDCGWPYVSEMRGKFVVLVMGNYDAGGGDNSGMADFYASYGGGPLSRKAFLMAFQTNNGMTPNTVFAQFEDISHPAIAPFLNEGGIVRTKTVIPTDEWNAWIAKRAQLISTDHPGTSPDTRHDHMVHCSPGAPQCQDDVIVEPGRRITLWSTDAAPDNGTFSLAYRVESGTVEWSAAPSATEDRAVGCLMAAASAQPGTPFLALCRKTRKGEDAEDHTTFLAVRDVANGGIQRVDLGQGTVLRFNVRQDGGTTCVDYAVARHQYDASGPAFAPTQTRCMPGVLAYQGFAASYGEWLFTNPTRNGTTVRAADLSLAQLGSSWAQLVDWTR